MWSASLRGRYSHAVEFLGKIMKRASHFSSGHGRAVAGDNLIRLERGEQSNRVAGVLPIGRVIHGRPMHLGPLNRNGIGRFLARGDERITRNDRPVLFSP